MSEDKPGFEETPAAEFDLFDEVDEEADARLIAEAEADWVAGRCVPHEEVAAWLRTWGTPDYKPMPRSWLK